MVTYDRKKDIADHFKWALNAETGNGPLAQWARAYRTDLEALLTPGETKKEEYQLSPVEIARSLWWIQVHPCVGINRERNLEDIDIMTKPTGIGTVTELRCKLCGRIEDVTDYDLW